MNDLFVMNMKRKILFVCLAFLALLQGWAQHTWQAGPVNLELIQRGNSEFPSGFSAFSLAVHGMHSRFTIRISKDITENTICIIVLRWIRVEMLM